MGIEIKRRKRGGRQSVATGSRGGTYGYSSGPILVGKRKKKVKPSPGSRYTDPTKGKKSILDKMKSGEIDVEKWRPKTTNKIPKKKKVKSSPYTDPRTKRKDPMHKFGTSI